MKKKTWQRADEPSHRANSHLVNACQEAQKGHPSHWSWSGHSLQQNLPPAIMDPHVTGCKKGCWEVGSGPLQPLLHQNPFTHMQFLSEEWDFLNTPKSCSTKPPQKLNTIKLKHHECADAVRSCMETALSRLVENPPDNIVKYCNAFKEMVNNAALSTLGKVKCKHQDWVW